MDSTKWLAMAIIYAFAAAATQHDCDFASGDEKIAQGNIVVCWIHSYRGTPANIICPRRIGSVQYSLYPKNPNETVFVQASRYPAASSRVNSLYEVPTRSAYGTVKDDLFSIVDDKENENYLVSYPSDLVMFVRNYSNIYMICAHELPDMDMISDVIRRYNEAGMFGFTSYHMRVKMHNDGDKKPGIGIVNVGLYGVCATHGCGSINTKLFLNQPDYDEDKKFYSCEVDVMSTPNIGFYCDGEIHPSTCFGNVNDSESGKRLYFGPSHFEFLNRGDPIIYAGFNRENLDEPFSGICTCTNRETGAVTAKITVFRKRHLVCDITSRLAANRVKPIFGKWCDVILHPRDELTIKFPPLNGYYCRFRDKFLNFKREYSSYISAFTPGSPKTLYLGASHPETLNPLISKEKMSDLIGGDAIEIDTSSRAFGSVSIRYKENKPLALLGRWNMHYRWDLRYKSIYKTRNITAAIKVGLAPTHKYVGGCEYEPSGIFDEKNVPLSCNNIFSDCVGERLRHCSYSEYASISSVEMGGIYCPPGQLLMPPNCGEKCYTRAGRGLLGTEDVVRILDTQRIPGLRVLGFKVIDLQSLSVSCSCVDETGVEKARLTVNKMQSSEVLPSSDTHRIYYNLREIVNISATGVGRENMEILEVPITRPFRGVQMDFLEGNQYWLVCPKGIILPESQADGMRYSRPQGYNNYGYKSDRPSYVESTLWKKFIPHRAFFPLNLDLYFYEAKYGMTGRLQELVAKRLDSIIGTNIEGLKIHPQPFSAGGPDFSVIVFSYPESAIVVVKDPLKNHATLSYLCGSLLPQDKQKGDAQAQETPELNGNGQGILYTTELHAIEITMIKIYPTDPYLYGCGVLESKEEIFRPETVPLEKEEKGLISGCRVDLTKSKRAGFYCPNPYKLIPEGCFNNVFVSKTGKAAPLMVISKRLRSKESRHFVIIETTANVNASAKATALPETTPIECRCVTFTGLVVSKILVENY